MSDDDPVLFMPYAGGGVYDGRWQAFGGVRSRRASEFSPDAVLEHARSEAEALAVAERSLRAMAAECLREAEAIKQRRSVAAEHSDATQGRR